MNPPNRVTGSEGLSIGTALAIETLFGTLPDDVKSDRQLKGVRYRALDARYREFKALYVNVHTLIRNYIGSIEGKDIFDISVGTAVIDIQQEISIIESLCGKQLRFVPYVLNYKRLKNHFPDALLRKHSTERQLAEQKILDEVTKLLPPKLILRSSTLSVGEYVKAVVVTHYPVDLLNRKQFQHLTLLESHTGRYKDPADWYTKLMSKNLTFNPPFNQLSLQILGDNTNFSPMTKRIKDVFAKAGEFGHWTPVTTLEKMRNDLKRLKTLPQTHTPEIEEAVNVILGLKNV